MGYDMTEYSEEQGRMRDYPVTCLCKEKKFTGKNYKGHKFETSHIILIPDQSSWRDMMFGAWLPDPELDPDENDQELLVDIGYPYTMRKRRVALNRANKIYPRDHHFLVMDEGLATVLKNNALGKRISLLVLSEKAELENVGLPTSK